MITIDDFGKIEMKVGLVTEAVNKEGSEKLIRLTVDLGEEKPRIIFTAVRTYGYTPKDFLNKKFVFVTNLEYKKIMDEESQGMILAVEEEGKPIFVIPAEDVAVGAKLR